MKFDLSYCFFCHGKITYSSSAFYLPELHSTGVNLPKIETETLSSSLSINVFNFTGEVDSSPIKDLDNLTLAKFDFGHFLALGVIDLL